MPDSLIQMQQTDYRLFLEQTLRSRRARNENYSLRSFARDLGLSASRLTEIFQRKDGLSSKRAVLVAQRLGLNSYEAELFLAMVEAQSGRSPITRRIASAKLTALKETTPNSGSTTILRDDCLAMLTGWHHFVLIELSRTPGFRSNPRWISARLALSVSEVNASIERLIRNGLLKRVKTKLVATDERFVTSSDVPSSALKDYHASILQRAIQCIDSQGVDEREFAASFFPVQTSDLPEMKDELRAARRKIVRKYEQKALGVSFVLERSFDPEKVEVYCVANQLFRISQPQTQH